MKIKSLKACYALFKITTAENLQYRAAAISGIIMCIFYAFIDITVFTVFYKFGSNTGQNASLSLSQMATYIWLKQLMLPPYGLYPEFREKIENGDIVLELCRPWDLYSHWITRLMAWRIGGSWWRSLGLTLIAVLLPIPYRLGMPISGLFFLLFIVSAASAIFFWAAYHMLVTAVRIGTTWGEGPCILMLLVSDILSGIYFPLQMWPDAVQKIMSFQPFASSFDLPLRSFIGSVTLEEAIGNIILQLIWSAVFVFLGRVVMNHKIKNLVVQGG